MMKHKNLMRIEKSLVSLIVGCAFSLFVFFIYILVLRSDYKSTALEINSAILMANDITISCGDDVPVSANISMIDYYDKFLLDRYTVVFGLKNIPVSADSIIICIGESKLSFTSLNDSTEIAIKWKTSNTEKNYIVRSQMSYFQLKAYYNNLQRRGR